MSYVRVKPFNAKAGALARRVCVGGQLFTDGTWYDLERSQADRVRGLTQETGAPYFEVVDDEATWRELTRRELAAKMGGPEAAALAEMFAAPAPSRSAAPKPAGAVLQSSFDGLAAKEVGRADVVRGAAAGLVPTATATAEPGDHFGVGDSVDDVGPEPAELPAVDAELMTKAELIEIAAKRGVEIDPKSKKSEIAAAIRAHR